jgi:small-conductance mechanosensitive channel
MRDIIRAFRRVRDRLPGRLVIVVSALAIAFIPLAVLAEAPSVSSASQAMPVMVENRRIVVLRGPIAGYTAAERATGAMRRIEAVLASSADFTVTTAEAEDGRATRVLLGGQPAFLITPVDIDSEIGETTQIVAREAANRLERAAAEWREQRTLRHLVIAGALAAGATLAYAAALWLLIRASLWSRGGLLRLAEARAGAMQVGGVRLLERSKVLHVTGLVLSLIGWGVGIALTSGWLTFLLERFPYTRPWGEALADNLLGLLLQVARAIVEAVPGLLIVTIIVMLARLVIRIVAVLFDRVERGAVTIQWLDSETVRPTRRIFTVVVWLFALAMAYPYLPGADTEAFKGLSVLVGLMVTFGGASVVGQAFSGLILMYMKAFRAGDYVRIGESEGTVIAAGMFATKIRTGTGEEITLPNSGIMATATKNYSRAAPGTGYVVDTAVTIGYATPWRQVQAMLQEAARRTVEIVPTPPPTVRQTELSDYYVEYRLIAYTPAESPALRADVLNRLHANIQDVFNEYGVQIMSPHYVADPAAPQVVPREKWHQPPARPE